MKRLLRISLDPVNQRDLEMVVGLENQIRTLQAVLDDKCSRILDRLLGGAPIEPGYQSAELREVDRGASRDFHLYVNGRKIK